MNLTFCLYLEPHLPINLKMDFGEKSKVMEVLNRAYAGSVVDKHVAAAAIREFTGKNRFNTAISCPATRLS